MTLLAETATLAWGYTMADVERCTRIAVAKTQSRTSAVDMDERHQSAWFAIVELLYDTEDKPTWAELLHAGCDAISRAQAAENHHHGISSATLKQGRAFTLYWGLENPTERPPRMVRATGAHAASDFTEALTDRLALPQMLALLTGEEYEALVAKAVHETDRAAAAALGLSPSAYQKRLYRARHKMIAAWVAPETPPAKPAYGGDTCTSGHSRAEHGVQRTRKSDGKQVWHCRACINLRLRRQRAAA